MRISLLLRQVLLTTGLIYGLGAVPAYSQQTNRKHIATPITDREYWLQQLDKMARPVLSNLANNNLKKAMPLGLSKRIDNAATRSKVAHLEAFGRVMSGIAPW